ncbi:hypothetical protein ACJX0J_016148, partial [Zea mays]
IDLFFFRPKSAGLHTDLQNNDSEPYSIAATFTSQVKFQLPLFAPVNQRSSEYFMLNSFWSDMLRWIINLPNIISEIWVMEFMLNSSCDRIIYG